MSRQFPHGTLAGYQRGCRCDDCRKGRRDYWRQWNARVKSTPSPGMPPHGTYNRYRTYGCRCQDCRTAVNAYEQERIAQRRKAAMP